MINLTDNGDDDRDDTDSGTLYGMRYDSGHKIRQLAEAEKREHIANGWRDKNS